MINNNDGPQPISIPEESFQSCSGCKYFEQHMVRSGRNPDYSYHCMHPDIKKEKGSLADYFNGNLQKDFRGWVKTPDWCPYKKPKADDAGQAVITERKQPVLCISCPVCDSIFSVSAMKPEFWNIAESNLEFNVPIINDLISHLEVLGNIYENLNWHYNIKENMHVLMDGKVKAGHAWKKPHGGWGYVVYTGKASNFDGHHSNRYNFNTVRKAAKEAYLKLKK